MAKHAKIKRLTFEFSRGWADNYNRKPFNEKEHPDWQDGWMSRQRFLGLGVLRAAE